MIYWQTFLDSIKLPSKKALFRLNRTGMDISVIYMFIIILISSIPSFIDQLTSDPEPGLYISTFFLIIYFFIFHYLPLNVIIFFALSAIAFIALGITKIMNRKLRFAILWKMTAYTTTTPFVVYTIIAFFYPVGDLFLGLSLLYTLILLIKMISIYPQRKVRPKGN